MPAVNRVKLASSHEGRYTYWRDDSDRYIYQKDESTGEWNGYLCSLASWESTFSDADWMEIAKEEPTK